MKKKILFLIGATALVASMIFSINFSIIADTGNFTLSSIVQMASADGEGNGSGCTATATCFSAYTGNPIGSVTCHGEFCESGYHWVKCDGKISHCVV